MAFNIRMVIGGAINMYGAKQKHPKLKEHNGEEVLVDATRNENGRTVIVVMNMNHELICAMGQH